MSNKTDVHVFIGDLEGGEFEAKVSHALSEAAASSIRHNTPSKVTLTFELKPMGNGTQVDVGHEIKRAIPTQEGSFTEVSKRRTPLYVTGGCMTFFPPNQNQLFGKKGEVQNEKE